MPDHPKTKPFQGAKIALYRTRNYLVWAKERPTLNLAPSLSKGQAFISIPPICAKIWVHKEKFHPRDSNDSWCLISWGVIWTKGLFDFVWLIWSSPYPILWNNFWVPNWREAAQFLVPKTICLTLQFLNDFSIIHFQKGFTLRCNFLCFFH